MIADLLFLGLLIVLVFFITHFIYSWFYLKEITFFGIFTFGRKQKEKSIKRSANSVSRNRLFGRNRIKSGNKNTLIEDNFMLGENEILVDTQTDSDK